MCTVVLLVRSRNRLRSANYYIDAVVNGYLDARKIVDLNKFNKRQAVRFYLETVLAIKDQRPRHN
jgi:hypothetical protein